MSGTEGKITRTLAITITSSRWLRLSDDAGVVKRKQAPREIDTVNRYEAAISCANIGNDRALSSIPSLLSFLFVQTRDFRSERNDRVALLGEGE